MEQDLKGNLGCALYRAAFNRSPLAIALATPLEARYIEVNDTFCRWFGLTRDQLIGKTYLDVGISIEAVDALVVADKVAHRDSGAHEVIVITPDKQRYTVNHWMEFLEIDGQPVVASFIQDISARKKLEEELHHALRLEAIGRLAGHVAHDFNNLLTVVVGNSELLMAKLPANARERRNVEPIHRSALRAAALTKQLLAFSRKQTVHPTVVDIHELVVNLAGMLNRLLPANITLVQDLPRDVVPVRVDPNGLELALTNLVINARDAMPNGGILRIGSRQVVLSASEAEALSLGPGAYVCLQVKDSGSGMDELTRSRAFEPFFTTKPEGKGTGLGLSTVQSVIKQSGGHVGVESRPGEGSTFTLYVPVSPEPVDPRRRTPVAALPRGSEKVLVVEDEHEVRAFCQQVLSSCGYSVEVAEDPREALSKSSEVDLLVCDVVLPQMAGPDLARRLSAEQPRLKTLFISGYPGDALEGDVGLPEGHTLLEKPFSVGSLAQQVRQVLDA